MGRRAAGVAALDWFFAGQSGGKLCGQGPDVAVVGSAAATQDLQTHFPMQFGECSSEPLRILLHQSGAVVEVFGAERSGIGQQPDDAPPDHGRRIGFVAERRSGE